MFNAKLVHSNSEFIRNLSCLSLFFVLSLSHFLRWTFRFVHENDLIWERKTAKMANKQKRKQINWVVMIKQIVLMVLFAYKATMAIYVYHVIKCGKAEE